MLSALVVGILTVVSASFIVFCRDDAVVMTAAARYSSFFSPRCTAIYHTPTDSIRMVRLERERTEPEGGCSHAMPQVATGSRDGTAAGVGENWRR